MNTKIVVLCNKDYTDRPELPDVVYVEYGNEESPGIPKIRKLDSEFNLVIVAVDGAAFAIIGHILDSLSYGVKYTIPAFWYTARHPDGRDCFSDCDDGSYVVFREPADTTHMVNTARYCLTDM